MYWTKAHDEWCLKFELNGCAKFLTAWIVRRTKDINTEKIDIDLRDFNKWASRKRGKPYDRKTLKLALAKIFDRTNGWISEHLKVSWYYFKIVVKPISFLAEKKAPKLGKTPEAETANTAWRRSSEDEARLQQQRNISSLDRVLRGVGLRYDKNALNRIWSLSGKCLDRIQQAIELMLYRHQTTDVPKPHGFLVQCLKENWQDGFDLYYQPELPKFDGRLDIGEFVSGLFRTAT